MKKVFASALAFLLVCSTAFAQTFYTQGFETDNSGWTIFGGALNATRVASGNNGVTSKTGSFHAEAVGSGAGGTQASSAATNWGGYSFVSGCAATACAAGGQFPAAGYITKLDIYLNLSATSTNDTRFDFISAINLPAGSHRRDFVFNAGFYNDTDGTGSGPRFVISASNNATRSSSFPKNPGRDPFAITATGWYTFQHRFYDAGSGVLACELSISDAGGTTIKTWVLSDPTDIIGSTIGGNRYGWFANNEFAFLAIDNATLIKTSTVKPFVFLADERITIERTKQTPPAGDLHSNGNVVFRRGDPSEYEVNVTAVGNVTIIGSENTIAGEVAAGGTIHVDAGSTITGTATAGAAVNVESLPELDYSAGGPNYNVPKSGSLTLAPGSYGNLTVNKFGTLKLSAGDYYFNQFIIKNDVVLVLDVGAGAITINVVGKAFFDKDVEFRVTPEGEAGSKKVTVNSMQSTDLTIGKESYVLGSIVAPAAKVVLGNNTQFRGSICAREITVLRDCLFYHHDSPGSLPGPGQLPKPVGDEEMSSGQSAVVSYQLQQNYPNPFNPSTVIKFALPQAGRVQLHIYNSAGQLVRTLANNEMAQGWHELTWDGRDQNGQTVATGVYLYRLTAQDASGTMTFAETRRMTFVK